MLMSISKFGGDAWQLSRFVDTGVEDRANAAAAVPLTSDENAQTKTLFDARHPGGEQVVKVRRLTGRRDGQVGLNQRLRPCGQETAPPRRARKSRRRSGLGRTA